MVGQPVGSFLAVFFLVGGGVKIDVNPPHCFLTEVPLSYRCSSLLEVGATR